MKTLRFAHTASALVLVHTKAAPDPAEWRAYLAAVVVSRRELRVKSLLVVTEGGAPDAAQRAALAQAYDNDMLLTAICSGSAVVRRVITAVGWITRARLRGFAYDDLAGAAEYLGVPPAQLGEITATVVKLQSELGAHRVKA